MDDDTKELEDAGLLLGGYHPFLGEEKDHGDQHAAEYGDADGKLLVAACAPTELIDQSGGKNDGHDAADKPQYLAEGNQRGALVGILGHNRRQRPQRDIQHGVEHLVDDVGAKRPDGFTKEAKIRHGKEQDIHDSRRDRREHIGAKLPPAGACFIGDDAHHGVVDGIPQPRDQDNGTCHSGADAVEIGEEDDDVGCDQTIHQILYAYASREYQFFRQLNILGFHHAPP